jgi:zinc protease
VCAISASAQKKGEKNNPQLTTPVAAPVTPYTDVKRDSLLNGLQIISLERRGDSSVKADLVIRAGSMFDLTGKTGLARMTQETLLAVNPRLRDELESLQAKIDWGVNWDTTWFRIETPANNFESVLEIVARLLVVETVRPDAFNQTQQRQLEMIKTREVSLAQRADETFLKALYGDHPYGHNIDGNEASITSIKQGDVYDFMRRLYVANDVSAVVVGNIPTERVMRVFKTFFGGWSKGRIAPTTFRPPRQITQQNLIKVEVPDATKVEIRGGVLGVKHIDPDFFTTEVMARILAARLKKDAESTAPELVVKSEPRILPGPFFFAASVSTDQAAAFSRRVTDSFAALVNQPATDEELLAAKSSLAGEYAARPVEHYLREIEVYSFPRNYPERIAPNIERITAADVQRVAKKLLDANALTVVVVGKVNDSFKSSP